MSRSSNSRLQRAMLAAACTLALAGCGEEPGEPQARTSRPSQGGDSSALRQRVDRMVTRLLTERGLDRQVAECALRELERDVGEGELESAIDAIRNTGAAPPGVIEAAAAAGEACGRP